MSTKQRLLTSLLILWFFVTITVLGLTNVSAGAPPPELIASETFADWGYQLWSEHDGYHSVRIEPKYNSVAELRAYANANKVLARQLRQEGIADLAVLITFRSPVRLDDFRAWATTHRLKVLGFTLRVMDQNGNRATVGGVPTGGQLVNDADLKRILDIVARHGETDVRGVISVDAILSATDYESVADDGRVFLADVTRSAVLQRLRKVAPQAQVKLESMMVPLSFPRMEDWGLDNFQ